MDNDLIEKAFLGVMNATDRELALPLNAWAERNLLRRRIAVALQTVCGAGADNNLIETMARGMQNAVIRDDEGEFPRLFDLLGFSGENKSHTVVKGLAQAALAAAREAGWVMVPVEPTFEMKTAGAETISLEVMKARANYDAACDYWPSMIEAAPKP